jgi:hypothetical protein
MRMRTNGDLRVESSLIPQFDAIKRVLEAISVLSTRGELSEDTFDLSSRHVNYVKQAARVLGLVSTDGEITPVGHRVLALSDGRRRAVLRGQFEQSACGQAWLAWSTASTIDQIEPSSAEAFLEQRTDLPPAMVKRRGRTLRRWCEQLRSEAAPAAAAEQPTVRKPKPRGRRLDARARGAPPAKSGAA